MLSELAGLVTGQDDVFEGTLTTPAGGRFWLRSDEVDYLRVGLAGYHGHFGNFVGITPEQDAADAAAFSKSLQGGALVVGAYYRAAESGGCWGK
ncbi:MAG: hypothetical protein EOO63_18510, partial [Hymenobacter sp.]